MRRIEKRIRKRLTEEFKLKLLNWASNFEEVAWLDSNQYHLHHTSFEAVLAVDAFTSIQTDSLNAFDDLNENNAMSHIGRRFSVIPKQSHLASDKMEVPARVGREVDVFVFVLICDPR